MPTPIARRNLTFNFGRSVRIVNGQSVAQTMEVSVTPLATPSAPDADLTLVGGVQEQTVLLNNGVNTAVFELVPSNAPGLTEPMNYLVAFRQGGITGALTTTPFAMPDADVAWDDMADLGNIIDGAIFLRQTDLGVPGRAAKLNDSGQVVDADDNPVAMPSDVTGVSDDLATEITARQAGDAAVTQAFQSALDGRATSTLNDAKAYTDDQFDTLQASVDSQVGSNTAAISDLSDTVDTNNTTVTGLITSLTTTVDGHTTALAGKANIDGGGRVPIAQIPLAAITSWIPVADLTAMYALTYPAQVQLGDVAYLSSGAAYALIATNPSLGGSWLTLTRLMSINGKTGVATLNAADVGALDATTGTLTIARVTGLQTALDAKAAASALATTNAAVEAIQNDTTIVKTSGGLIADSILPADIALIDEDNNLTKKDGTVVPIGSLSGVSRVNGETGDVTITPASIGAVATGDDIAQSDVTGLVSDLAARVLTSDSRLTNSRTPTSHASSHASAGSDPITISQGQVTGLSTALTNKADQSDMTTAQSTIAAHTTALTTKADLDGVGGHVQVAQIPTISGASKLSDWGTKADLVGGRVPTNQTSTTIPTSSVVGLDTALAGKADLTGPGGTVNPAQLPPATPSSTFQVANRGAMLALSSAIKGDFCVITAGADKGSYRLATTDPTVFANWVQLPNLVSSVNGKVGDAVLNASDVGAIDNTSGTITIARVTGLSTQLATFATQDDLAGILSTSSSQALLSDSTPNKQAVNFVSTANIASKSGPQTIDGALRSEGNTVLLTAQTSSIDNGIWVINSGAWTRATDAADTKYLVKGTLVVVTQGSTNNINTLWQETAASGVIGTDANNWAKIGSVAAPLVYTNGNGLNLTGSQFSVKPTTGISVGAGGVGTDNAVVTRKAAGVVPSSGSVTVSITHNLNNLAPDYVFVDIASGNIVDAGVTVTNANTISVEFGSPPASNQFRYCIYG